MEIRETTDHEAHFGHKGDEKHLMREIMRTHQAIMNLSSRKVGMPSSRMILLRLLAVSYPEKLGPKELSRKLGVDPAAMTRQIKSMEAEQLVIRQADSSDGRRSNVQLTEKGWQIFGRVHDKVHEFEKALSLSLSDEEILTAIKVLDQVRISADNL
jgi:DNA-binding MarR family transcriptional regulator